MVAIVAPRNFEAPSEIDLVQPSASSIRCFFRVSFQSNAPINCMPHYPPTGNRWGFGGRLDLTHGPQG